jgi:hypothetical protein
MSVEFVCEQCDALVYALGLQKPPCHGLCMTCWFIEQARMTKTERREFRERIKQLGDD